MSSQKSQPLSVYVLMGTCGCGKTSIANELSRLLNCPFIEGDTYHPKDNVEKMSKGIPLTDDDRWDWLRIIRDTYVQQSRELLSQAITIKSPRVIIVTCSSLRKIYRDLLRDVPNHVCTVTFVYLKGSYELIASRMEQREDHFMGARMLNSQWNTLEEPDPNQESVIVQDITKETHVIAQQLATIIEKRITNL